MIKFKDIKKYYNTIYKNKKDKSMNPYEYYPYFIKLLNAKKREKILDIGCGTGFLLRAAEKKGLNTFGLDISSEAVKVAKKIAKKSVIKRGLGEKLPFKSNYFDYIACTGSLEHFLDISKGIKEMVRVAKDNALFCIIVPNRYYFGWIFKRDKGTKQAKIREKLLSLRQWKEVLMRNGLKVRKTHQDKWFMKEINIFKDFKPINIFSRSIRFLLWKILPLQLTYQFIFICKKK